MKFKRSRKKIFILILIVIVTFIFFLHWNQSNKFFKEKSSRNPEDEQSKDKIKFNIFWTGSLEVIDKYRDYWVFSTETNQPNHQRFLIAKNNSLFNNKKLDQKDLTFILSYSKNEVVKKIEKIDSAGNPQLTILEDKFSLTPTVPWREEADFATRWGKGPDIKAEVEFVNQNNNNFVFKVLTNQTENRGEGMKKIKFFHILPDNYRIKKLLQENKLSHRKKFFLLCDSPVNGDCRLDEISGNFFFGKLSNLKLSEIGSK